MPLKSIAKQMIPKINAAIEDWYATAYWAVVAPSPRLTSILFWIVEKSRKIVVRWPIVVRNRADIRYPWTPISWICTLDTSKKKCQFEINFHHQFQVKCDELNFHTASQMQLGVGHQTCFASEMMRRTLGQSYWYVCVWVSVRDKKYIFFWKIKIPIQPSHILRHQTYQYWSNPPHWSTTSLIKNNIKMESCTMRYVNSLDETRNPLNPELIWNSNWISSPA